MNRRLSYLVPLVFIAVLVLALVLARFLSSREEEGEVQTDVGVHVGTVQRATLHRYVTAYGYVEAAPPTGSRPAGGALISTFVGGVLTQIDCVEGGQVREGSVLFRLDSRMAEVAVQRARQEVDFAQKAYQRQQSLLGSDGTSQKAFQAAEQQLADARSNLAAAQTDLAYLNITTPLTGTVTRLEARVGQYVDANTLLAEVVDLNRLVVSADVPAQEAPDLAVGQAVILGALDREPDRAEPGSSGAGSVGADRRGAGSVGADRLGAGSAGADGPGAGSSGADRLGTASLDADTATARGALLVVGRNIDPRTGTYHVQASLPPGAGLMPGEFTGIRIVTDVHEEALAVPEVSLVTRTGEGSWLMIVDGDQAVRTPVTVGIREGGWVEVSGEGIGEGTTIVTEDAYSLPPQTKIHIVEN